MNNIYTIYPLISFGVISFIYKGTEVHVIPIIIPTINLPSIKKEIVPTKVSVIPKMATTSEIIIAPLLPNVRLTLAYNIIKLIKYKTSYGTSKHTAKRKNCCDYAIIIYFFFFCSLKHEMKIYL